MSQVRILILTTLTMVAFAGNSLLCRQALRFTHIDPASFTAIRLVSGALALWVIVMLFRRRDKGSGDWGSAVALFAYAAAFSFAYVSLPAATGALLLFGAVQATMTGYGIWRGERLGAQKSLGLALAIGGLVGLLLPGLTAPPLAGSVLMLVAGFSWGIYSLRSRGIDDPTRVTAGNFLRAVPLTVALSAATLHGTSVNAAGAGYAIASGALTSGVGYAVWYAVLPALKPVNAATVQLSVPVITGLGGVLLLGELLTARLVAASLAILGGIALVTLARRR